MTLPPCFDAVVFDLDGTLVATDRFWLDSAERGARRAFHALGLARALPTPAQWLSLVGLPLEVGFRGLFPELTEAQRRAVLAACVEEEEAELRRGGVPCMPGAREVVGALHARGIALGIASNCQRSYLEHMLDGLGLRSLVRAAYCRESPGITSKGDMLARFLEDLDSRAVVLVGDRASDREAAWENGLPHVHCAFGFAQGDEAVEAEGRIGALEELESLLARRGRWIERALERLGVLEGGVRTLGITGPLAAGKTLFARHAARLLRARGFEVVLARSEFPAPERLPPGAVLLLEGVGLLDPRARTGLERLVYLEVSEDVARRRVLGRARGSDPGALLRGLEQARAEEQRLVERFPPRASADLVLEGDNPLGPPDPGRGLSA